MEPLLEKSIVDIYWRNGYHLLHQQVFGADKLERLTALFDELHALPVAEKRQRDQNSVHRQDYDDRQLQSLNMCHLWEPRLLDWLLAEEVLDLVECVIGSDIALFSSHFICKQPGDGVITPWHDDRFYWRSLIDPMDKIVTVWLALDDSTLENGCMCLVPGTHLSEPNVEFEQYDMDKSLFPRAFKRGEVDESKAVPIELKRGECSLHDGRITHGAQGNHSPHRRCGYTMRYFSTELKLLVETDKHPTWLARGKDRAGNRYAN